MTLGNQLLGIVSPPVRFGGVSTAISPVGLCVVQRGTRRFGVEIIIKLHAVNRVVFHHFGNDAGYPVAHFRNPRVEDKAVAGGTNPVTMQHENAGGDLRESPVEFADGFGRVFTETR